MAFVYRENLDRPLTSGEMDGNLDRIQTLHDAMQLKADRLYDTTSAGLADTNDGEYFATTSISEDESLRIYRNDAGSGTLIAIMPSIPAGERAIHTGDMPADHASGDQTHGAPAGERIVHTGDMKMDHRIQLLYDSGRFDGGNAGLVRELSAPWVMPNIFFDGANGATFSEEGQFIHNNNNFGGSAGTMPQTIEDLIVATGREGNDARYGVEFYVTRAMAGAGTAASVEFNGVTRYRLLGSGNAAIFSSDARAVFVCWVRAVSSPLGILRFDELYINGVEQPGDYELDPSEGWVHWQSVASTNRGYSSAFPGPYSNDGGGCLIALPAVYGGYVQLNIHTAPLIGLGATNL